MEWVKLIYKGNEIGEPGNYGGITLNIGLGKHFSTVLYSRLTLLLEKEGIYSIEHAGFRNNQ